MGFNCIGPKYSQSTTNKSKTVIMFPYCLRSVGIQNSMKLMVCGGKSRISNMDEVVVANMPLGNVVEDFHDGSHHTTDVPSSCHRTDTVGARPLDVGKVVARMVETKEHGVYERELRCTSPFPPS
jgi:hypothetical protein